MVKSLTTTVSLTRGSLGLCPPALASDLPPLAVLLPPHGSAVSSPHVGLLGRSSVRVNLLRGKWHLGWLELGHQLAEALEQVAGVVGAGPGLGMILNAVADSRHLESLDGVVVQVHVSQARRGRFHGLRVDGEAVVLTGDLDARRVRPPHRVISTTMSKGELEGLRSESQAEH